MSDAFRLVRLVGNGDASGGGLPLPDAFAAVLQELLDHGPAAGGHLTGVTNAALSYKHARVTATWKTWDDFTADILAQLADAGLVTERDGKWMLTGKFTPGKRHVIIPSANIGVTVRTQADRTRLNAMSRAMIDAKAAESRLDQLDEESPAVQGIRMLLRKAVQMLEVELGDRIPPPSARERGPLPRPTARELAREKYGLDGNRPASVQTNVFGQDGLRRCVRCGKLRPPEDYQVYWESGHNHSYFLRGACESCERERSRNRRKQFKEG